MNLIPFEECHSHPDRLLADHQTSVANLMEHNTFQGQSTPPFFTRLAKLVGLFHDVGKGTWFFQKGRLESERIVPNELGNHSKLSALVTLKALEHAIEQWTDCESERCLILAISLNAILQHHGNLKDLSDVFENSLRDDIEDQQLQAIDLSGVKAYIENSLNSVRVSGFDFRIYEQSEIRRKYRRKIRRLKTEWTNRDYVMAGQLFSLLVWADKIDAATGGNSPQRSRIQIQSDLVSNYCMETFGEPCDHLALLRTQVRQEVESNLLSSENRLFTLTAPTGSGKTIAVLNAAIKLRNQIAESENADPASIIYCMPFTSIIDQNHDVISSVLKWAGLCISDDLLLKHHHLSNRNYKDQNETDFGYNIGQLLTTAWDSEIVVTTFIQFFNSLLGNKNKTLRKLNRIPGSIILLDEVQAIPRKYWETIDQILTTYATEFDCRFLLLTATKPLILNSKNSQELLPSHPEIFAKFDRYEIHPHCGSEIEFADFKTRVLESIRACPKKTTMVVMNTVQSSIDLFEFLRDELMNECEFDSHEFIYLSTNITPRDRRNRINEISEMAKGIVVTTQVVEAGVDISVDVVHRDLAPLDSIIQCAGRCNRSNEKKHKGKVHIWNIRKDENEWQFAFIYSRLLLNATKTILAKHKSPIPETEVLQMSEEYFQIVKQKQADSLIHEYVQQLEFEKIELEFNLIDDKSKTNSYFVATEKDPDAEKLWSQFQELSELETISRRSNFQFFKTEFYERVVNVRLNFGETPNEEIILITNDSTLGDYYDSQIGFKGSGLAIF